MILGLATAHGRARRDRPGGGRCRPSPPTAPTVPQPGVAAPPAARVASDLTLVSTIRQVVDPPTTRDPGWLADVDPMAAPGSAPSPPVRVARMPLDPLFLPRWARAIVSTALSVRTPEGPLDIDRLVVALSHAQPITRLPRLPSPTAPQRRAAAGRHERRHGPVCGRCEPAAGRHRAHGRARPLRSSWPSTRARRGARARHPSSLDGVPAPCPCDPTGGDHRPRHRPAGAGGGPCHRAGVAGVRGPRASSRLPDGRIRPLPGRTGSRRRCARR